MFTHKPRLTAAHQASAQAHSPTSPVTKLLDLYLATPSKQRDQQFMSTARAAEISGMSQSTIQLWIDNRSVSALRIGNNYKVTLDSLREYLLEKDALAIKNR